MELLQGSWVKNMLALAEKSTRVKFTAKFCEIRKDSNERDGWFMRWDHLFWDMG